MSNMLNYTKSIYAGFAALKVQCVGFIIIYCEKLNITYAAMFMMVCNHLHIVIVVFLFA